MTIVLSRSLVKSFVWVIGASISLSDMFWRTQPDQQRFTRLTILNKQMNEEAEQFRRIITMKVLTMQLNSITVMGSVAR